MTFIVGLTGGIGSGKTTVADFFTSQAIDVIDADSVGRLLIEQDESVQSKIKDYLATYSGDIDKLGNSALNL